MMKFEKKHEDWIYDEFKTQSGIGIKEIRYLDWFEARKHHDNISWKKELIINQYPVSRRGITDVHLAQSICRYMRCLDEEEREAEEKC